MRGTLGSVIVAVVILLLVVIIVLDAGGTDGVVCESNTGAVPSKALNAYVVGVAFPTKCSWGDAGKALP